MLKWKGYEFRTKGVIIEKTPKLSKANKKITIYDVPGRNGFISIDTNAYESFSLSVECHLSENININEICEWLDGYGTLSFDGVKQYTAIINNAIDFEKVQMFKKFIIQFLVNPIAEDITETTYVVGSSPDTLNIATYSDVYPILEITTTGQETIAINNISFTLLESGSYILDCKNKVITKNNLNAATKMNGDFPTLNKVNTITYGSNISSFTIKYKKTYLYGG